MKHYGRRLIGKDPYPSVITFGKTEPEQERYEDALEYYEEGIEK